MMRTEATGRMFRGPQDSVIHGAYAFRAIPARGSNGDAALPTGGRPRLQKVEGGKPPALQVFFSR